MEYTGLARRYPIDRPLSSREYELQLKQKLRLDVEPADQLSVIRVNSTYLELVDKYYGWKGVLTSFLVAAFAILLGMVGAMTIFSIVTPGRLSADWLFLLGMYVLVAAPIAGGGWLLRKESFSYTHYPIRFNRKTRMVHVFRLNGTVLSVPWDGVFFCLGALPQMRWEVQGHVLDKDGKTVRETFAAFPQIALGEAERGQLMRHWEFIRRYMEEGPRDAYERVKICLPIANQREPIAFGFHRMHVEAGTNVVLSLPFAVMALVTLPGRWFAMRTSKIPVWPKEIEDACRVDPRDPYVRDASMNDLAN